MRFGIFYEHQQPRPWEEGSTERLLTDALEQVELADRLGFDYVWEVEHHFLDEYYAILASEECVPAGFAVNPAFAVVLPMMLHEDEAEAIERGVDGAHFFGYSLAHYYVFGEHEPGRTDLWQEFQRDRASKGFAREVVRPGEEPLGVKLLEQGLGSLRGAIGTPDQITELVQRFERAGVDQIIFALQTGHTQHAHICEALELFAERVMPRFAERAEEVDAERRA